MGLLGFFKGADFFNLWAKDVRRECYIFQYAVSLKLKRRRCDMGTAGSRREEGQWSLGPGWGRQSVRHRARAGGFSPVTGQASRASREGNSATATHTRGVLQNLGLCDPSSRKLFWGIIAGYLIYDTVSVFILLLLKLKKYRQVTQKSLTDDIIGECL